MTVRVYSNDTTIDWKATGEDRIVQNVKNILRTRQFEVPFLRDMGINPDFISASMNEMKSEFEAHVIDVIRANEERANVISVKIESFDENGNYIIAVDLEV